jgi:hypothetical protein
LKLLVGQFVNYNIGNLPFLLELSIKSKNHNTYDLPIIDYSSLPRLNSLSIEGQVAVESGTLDEISGKLENLTFICCEGSFKILNEVQNLRAVHCDSEQLFLYQCTKLINNFHQLYKRGDPITIKSFGI